MMLLKVKYGYSCIKKVLILHLQEDFVTCILKVVTSAAFSLMGYSLCQVNWLTLHFGLAVFYFKTNG
jgi:hypothetical protein